MPKRLGPSSLPQHIVGHRKDGRPIYTVAGGAPDAEPPRVEIPTDLTLVSDEELDQYEESAVAEFDRLNSDDHDITPTELEYAMSLADGIDNVRAEKVGRAARAEQAENSGRARLAEQQATLQNRVHGREDDGGQPIEGEVVSGPGVDTEAVAAAAAEGATRAMLSVMQDRSGSREAHRALTRGSLQDARRYAGEDEAPAQQEPLTVTAAVAGRDVNVGQNVSSLDQLSDIANRKAKQLTTSRDGDTRGGAIIATVQNKYEHTVDDRTPIRQVDELFRYLQGQDRSESAEALVAAGGWCAPAEIRYDFFNIACTNGMIDLPTFGVTRGGIRFPVSPSMADLFSGDGGLGGFAQTLSVTTNPWLWTETSDIQAATGGAEKPCVRVPCPTFDEETLEGIGICLTAGNLTDDAYPEATQNTLSLLMAGHDHALNGRIINQMVALSEAAIDTGSFAATGGPVFNQVYGGVALGAVDYRARYGMCEDDTLEVVAPYWLKEVIRADLSHRTGIDPELVSDAQIQSWFNTINVRVQWVNDYQVRGANQFGNATEMVDWPTSANIMMYAAGTFLRGNGLSLDLGVVRDSVLNATNDHTAAWSEEFFLVARVGHESRQYTINFAVNGRTGAADIVGHNL